MGPAIDECAAGGCPNLITVSGSRRGMSDAEGADNSVAFLNRVKAQAEDKGVTICLELLNSKIDHKDQMCDHTAWGVEVCRRVNSPRVKLLFDIYHMQIMEGDICRTIRDNFQWIAHFHTGGVPGRHEIDGTQELNYHFVAQTIAELGLHRVHRARIQTESGTGWGSNAESGHRNHGRLSPIAWRPLQR